MKIVRKPKPFGDLDVTSFSDIAFLLIIFFVLTTTFIRTTGLAVTIPSSTQDPEKKSESEYPTLILAAESMQFQEKDITMEQFRVKLAEMKLAGKPEKDRFIVLESAPEVSYDRYFEVVTAISKNGGILAITESDEKESKEGGEAGSTNAPAAGGAA